MVIFKRPFFLSVFILIFIFIFSLFGCGFHLQGETTLAPPLHRLFLQTKEPYGTLARSLRQYLKVSKVEVVPTPLQAETILVIRRDEASQVLLSVSGTQQTRQYNLTVTVVFEITDAKGRRLIGPQTLSETRTLTVQANQILGSSNEANLLYQQMRRVIASSMINRLASTEVTNDIMHPKSSD